LGLREGEMFFLRLKRPFLVLLDAFENLDDLGMLLHNLSRPWPKMSLRSTEHICDVDVALWRASCVALNAA
jgi:hypothetical protein